MNIKVMADYDCPPLWCDGDGVGPIDPADLEISAKLAEDLWAWGADYDGTLNRDDPVNSGFASTTEEVRFEDTGRALTRRLARELQGTAKVCWWKDEIPTDFDLGVADRVLVVDGAGYDSKHRRENAVLADVRDPGQLDRLREVVAVDENAEGFYWMTPGSPTVVLLRGREVVAAFVSLLPYLRCAQLWAVICHLDGQMTCRTGWKRWA